MLGSVWNFVKRHRRKFTFLGVTAGGVYLMYQWAEKKLNEMQEKEAEEALDFARRKHHFESNQRTCNMTLLSLLPAIKKAVEELADTEKITEQLQAKPANKLELWEELKVLSFARAFATCYVITMVSLLLRVQLNVLGGYMYCDAEAGRNGTVENMAVATPEVQKRYLDTVHHVLDTGMNKLFSKIYLACKQVLSSVGLKEGITLERLEGLVCAVRNRVEERSNGAGDRASPLAVYLLPDLSDKAAGEGAGASPSSRSELHVDRMVWETAELLRSADFNRVMCSCVEGRLSRLQDTVAEKYKAEAQDPANVRDVAVPLARLLPVMSAFLASACSGPPNPFVQELILHEQVKELAGNVYEAFCQPPAVTRP